MFTEFLAVESVLRTVHFFS